MKSQAVWKHWIFILLECAKERVKGVFFFYGSFKKAKLTVGVMKRRMRKPFLTALPRSKSLEGF